MPKGQRSATLIPEAAKFTPITGPALLELRQAAKLAGIHPVVLEMGQRLLKNVGTEGGRFILGTPDLKAKALPIEQAFVTGLRKVARALGPGGLAVKSTRKDDALVFWYETAPGPKPKRG